MLKLKNYMVASVIAVLTLFSFNLKAETKEQITVIFNGKAGGSYNARTQLYKDGLIAAGFDVSEERMKIKQAVKLFKETDKPTIMVFSNNMVHRYDLFTTVRISSWLNINSRCGSAQLTVQKAKIA